MKMNVEEKRGRGRSKNKWLDTSENDIKAVSLCVKDLEN
jgi:hypothetical protein